MAESKLYPHIKNWILSPEFTPTRGRGFHDLLGVASITASLQWLEGAGNWMRPDISLATVSRRKYEAFAQLSLFAFEVKDEVASLTEPLFQALSYSRFADFCYLAAPSGPRWSHEIRQLAGRFGVGLIEFEHVEVWDSYNVTIGAQMSPDPILREAFVDSAFEQLDRERISSRLMGRNS